MSNLLDVTRISKMRLPKAGQVLAMQCAVSGETAPYLVTTSKGLTWVKHCSAEGTVAAAVRLGTKPEQFFTDVVEAVHAAGLAWEWGNVLPMTREGMQEALDHVLEYDLGDVEILIPTAVNEQDREIAVLTSHFDYATRPCSWLPGDLAVVVPKDRGFVGLVYRVTSSDMVGLVHNAARGMAIVSCRLDHWVEHKDDEANVAE
jgi:hypothetical protein